MTDFDSCFKILTGNLPFPWQKALYERFVSEGKDNIPSVASLPTGLGKTSVIAIWLIALANRPAKMPRRLAYVVNRRTVVDQTTDEVEKLRRNLEQDAELQHLRKHLGSLAISTIRGQFADNREWSADPSKPAVICGTVDMIGSRLLFSGYRIGFRAKPLHAGFLGQDVLLVHDEAHLEPAFQQLIETIQSEQWKAEQAGELPWPKLRVMALSATTRHAGDGSTGHVLTKDERTPPETIPDPPTEPIHHVWRRLGAKKAVCRHKIEDEKKLADGIARLALKHNNSGQAVLVFVRKVEDVAKIVNQLPKDSTEQLTGTLRGLERDELVMKPVFQRFLPKSNRLLDGELAGGTVYLVCTSAGEVGVNISADHLVSDLSTFDSMAQRFGRVNRFGDRDDTRIDVVHPASFGKKDKNGKVTMNELEQRRQRTLKLLEQLNGDASSAALEQLDPQKRLEAFAPVPTILPATDILFDAWSLTTIRKKMPGRPPVEPYLHGISEWEPPQTQVAWREEVGIITGDLLDRYKPADLLGDYPLKTHELLHDRSYRVFKHLVVIADRHPELPVWLISDNGSINVLVLKELADKNKKDRINACTVLLMPSAGGLSGGLLDGKAESADDVACHSYEDKDRTERRRDRLWDNGAPPIGMTLIRTIDINPNADEYDSQESEEVSEDELADSQSTRRFWHWYVKPHDAEEAARASAAPITWDHHTRDVVQRTTDIVNAIQLPERFKKALILAAKLHDLGKKRELWQRSIGNPHPTDWHAKPGKPADGPRWRPRRISNYRHEFGSLLDALAPEQSHFAEFNQLDNEMKDLVLHLIAAHHGRARPHFPPEESIDPAPGSHTLATEQVIETPCRFARLQRKYGRWGLAYLESLLRAADWAASAEPSAVEEGTS